MATNTQKNDLFDKENRDKKSLDHKSLENKSLENKSLGEDDGNALENKMVDKLKPTSNLINFTASSAEPNAMELNRRLKSFEKNISNLENKLLLSHNEFRSSVSSISKKTDVSSSALNLAQTHLRSLDRSYKSLTTQSDILTKKTASLGSLFEKAYKKQSDSFQFIDNKIIENRQQLNKELEQIKNSLALLENNYTKVTSQTHQLLSNVNNLQQSVQNSSQQQGQKLQTLERRVNLKTNYLDNQIKQMINTQGKDLEQLQNSIVDNEKRAVKELLVIKDLVGDIAKDQEDQIQKLNTKQKNTQGIMASLGVNLSKLSDKLVNFHQQLKQKIDTNQAHSLSKFNQIENQQLSSDKKHQDSNKIHQEHDRQISFLQKSNNHLAYRVDDIDDSITELDKKSHSLEFGQKNIQHQIVTNAGLENTHFNSLLAVLGVVIISISTSFFYTWKNMDNENNTLLAQQHQQRITLTEQHLYSQQLQQTLSEQRLTIEQNEINEKKNKQQLGKLQGDLGKQKQLASNYHQQLKQQQQSMQKQQHNIKTNLQLVDEKVLYLNQTIGPFSDLESGALEGPLWLENQKAQNHTIKLKTFDSQQQLFAFIASEAYYLKQNLAFYPSSKNGKRQYTLVYGSFEKKSQAQVAIEDLPYQLSSESEGIVSMREIQSIL